MKKILLLLAFAFMASFSLVSHAGGPGSGFGGGFQMPSDPIEVTIMGDKISLCFYPGYVNCVSLTNINTGESYVRNYTPSRCVVDLPFSGSNGTWEISASSDDGRLYYKRFVVNKSNIPQSPLDDFTILYQGLYYPPLLPIDWINDGNPIDNFGPEMP